MSAIAKSVKAGDLAIKYEAKLSADALQAENVRLQSQVQEAEARVNQYFNSYMAMVEECMNCKNPVHKIPQKQAALSAKSPANLRAIAHNFPTNAAAAAHLASVVNE